CVSRLLNERALSAMLAYLEVLQARRADKCWVFAPKYTTRREIGQALNWPTSYDDRALLSMLLEAGEFTAEQTLEPPGSAWHITVDPLPETQRQTAKAVEEKISHELGRIAVIYYKPHVWVPALRLEVSRAVSENRSRLAALL